MEKRFKYQLAKRGKIQCTGCGKKTAVAYIDVESGNLIDGAMRCDREVSCGYHKRPESTATFVRVPELAKKPTQYLSLKLVEELFLGENDNNFFEFLRSKFSAEEIKKVKYDYLLSGTRSREVIFWQIDELERVRTGKKMLYNSETGKRVKSDEGSSHISWMHKQPFELKQCLFGQHLLKEYRKKPVAIVESEKTAVVLSIKKPNYIWMATGSLNGFKIELLNTVKNRDIFAFPDKGCFKNWSEKAELMNGFGFNITVSNYLESLDIKDGSDLADIFI